MSVDPKFQAASESAESWPSTVHMIARLVQGGSVEPALQLLPYLMYHYIKHAQVLGQAMDKINGVTSGPIRWAHGRGLSGVIRCPNSQPPHRWLSATEAAMEIARLTLDRLFLRLARNYAVIDPKTSKPRIDPKTKKLRTLQNLVDENIHRNVRPDALKLIAKELTPAQQFLAETWAKAFAIPLDEVADMRAGIRSERERLLAQLHPRGANSSGVAADLPSFSPTDNDERVIMYLLEMYPRLQKQIEIMEGARLAKQTVSDSLSRLRNHGVVCRPERKRKGETLTEAGKKLAEHLLDCEGNRKEKNDPTCRQAAN